MLQTSSMNSETLCKRFHHLRCQSLKEQKDQSFVFHNPRTYQQTIKETEVKSYSDENEAAEVLALSHKYQPLCSDHFPPKHY